MNFFQENAENNWPEDEAFLEAEHYVVTVLQKYDCMTNELKETLLSDLKYWHNVFENDNFTRRFAACFNSKVPDFCRITTEMLAEVIGQKDLFES